MFVPIDPQHLGGAARSEPLNPFNLAKLPYLCPLAAGRRLRLCFQWGKDRPPSSRFHRREAEETEKQRGRGDREAEWRWHGWMAVSCPRTGIVPVGRRPNELLFRFDASYAKILGLQYPVMDELISPMKQAA